MLDEPARRVKAFSEAIDRVLGYALPDDDQSDLLIEEAAKAVYELTRVPALEPVTSAKPTREPVFDPDESHFAGWSPRDCGDHRTVGPHRAWCFDCGEWCYPHAEMACGGCGGTT
jgi:hypothetical protein